MINLLGQKPLTAQEIFARLFEAMLCEGEFQEFFKKIAPLDGRSITYNQQILYLPKLARLVYSSIEKMPTFSFLPPDGAHVEPLGFFFQGEKKQEPFLIAQIEWLLPFEGEGYAFCKGKKFIKNLRRLAALLAEVDYRYPPPVRLLHVQTRMADVGDRWSVVWGIDAFCLGYEYLEGSWFIFENLRLYGYLPDDYFAPCATARIYGETALSVRKKITEALLKMKEDKYFDQEVVVQ